MFSVVKPRAKMQELLSLNPEMSVSNRFQEVLFDCNFTRSDEKKLRLLYEKCQNSKPAISDICIRYLEEIAPEGKSPYTAQQVEQFLRFFFVSRRDEHFIKVNKRIFMSFREYQFQADQLIVILGQLSCCLMKKIMEELDLPSAEVLEYLKAVSSSINVSKWLLIEVMTEQMLGEITEELSWLLGQKSSIEHAEEMKEAVHNRFQPYPA